MSGGFAGAEASAGAHAAGCGCGARSPQQRVDVRNRLHRRTAEDRLEEAAAAGTGRGRRRVSLRHSSRGAEPRYAAAPANYAVVPQSYAAAAPQTYAAAAPQTYAGGYAANLRALAVPRRKLTRRRPRPVPAAAASSRRSSAVRRSRFRFRTSIRCCRATKRRNRSPQPAAAIAPALASAPANPPDESNYPVDPKFQRQVVDYHGDEPPDTIIVDTPNKFLFLVEDGGKALRYGIGVGRPGFTWSGVHTVTAMKEWPDWTPPPEMIERQPGLPRFMPGGLGNPLGARALYLGSTLYRIHGSNEPWTIGSNVSSGCIRMRNADVEDLYNRVKIGTKVVVL